MFDVNQNSRPLYQIRNLDFSYHLGKVLVHALKDVSFDIPASRIVFATDYPQEIRKREVVRDFVRDIRGLGPDGERILSGNVSLLLKEQTGAPTA